MSKEFARVLCIGTRVSKGEKELLESICKAKGIPMSELLRRAILAYLATEAETLLE